MRLRSTALTTVVLFGLSGMPAAHAEPPSVQPYKRPGINQMVSLTSANTQADGNSYYASTSADGRYVAFASAAPDMVPGDANGKDDIFVRDMVDRTTERISLSSAGEQADGDSMQPNISANGRYVTFLSYSTNLTTDPGKSPSFAAVYVRDLMAGATELIMRTPSGTASQGGALGPSISADGNRVAFFSSASDLVPNDTNGVQDVFVRDRATSQTTLVSAGVAGALGNARSTFARISPDGTTVAFRSDATNLVSSDQNGQPDIFLRDLTTGTTELISVSTTGVQGNGDAFSPTISISGDNRLVVFQSSASNMVPNDMNGFQDPFFGSDVFVRDRQTDRTERVSLTSAGAEFNDAFAGTISADGRYIAFHATRMGEASNDFGAFADVYVHDRLTAITEHISATPKFSDPVYGDSENATISADGRYVYFQTGAGDFVPGDGNEYMDIVRRVRGSERGLLSARIESVNGDSKISGVATFGGEVLATATDAAGEPGLGPIGADIIGASATYRHEDADVLFRMDLASLPSNVVGNGNISGTGSLGGLPGLVYGFSFVLGGQRWEIRGSNVGASEASAPAFVRYSCNEVCVGGGVPVPGGFGTAGSEISISLPAPLMGLQPGEKLESISGFVGPGALETGAPVALDSIALADVTTPDAQVRIGRGTVDSDAVYEIGAYSFFGKFGELLAGTVPEGGSFWARVCLDDRCGAPEKIQ